MNREQQTCRQCGHSIGAHAMVAGKERCARGCECSGFVAGDATPPATPEPTDALRLAAATLADEVLASKQNVGHYLRGLAKDVKWYTAQPPAASGDVERLINEMLNIYGVKFTDANSREIAVESWARQFRAAVVGDHSTPGGTK